MEVPSLDDQEPVFLWAPSARNGITLMQRLITSSREILIMGENRLLTLNIPHGIAAALSTDDKVDESRQRLASGDFAFWSSAAGPVSAVYKNWLESATAALFNVYQYSAMVEGYKRWGIKEPLLDARVVNTMNFFMPKAKHVFIYRNLPDVLRSHKARGWIKSASDCESYAANWAKSVPDILPLEEQGVGTVVRYEELMKDPDPICDRLEKALGCAPFDRSVLQKKVNTFQGSEDKGHSPSQYIEPADLTPEEWAAAKAVGSEAMELCGYEWDDAS